MTDPTYAETYPQYMQLDADAECEDEARAGGWHFVPILAPNPEMVETFLRRANEDAAAVLASDRRYLLTGKGRIEAERVDAAARAQLDATKETTMTGPTLGQQIAALRAKRAELNARDYDLPGDEAELLTRLEAIADDDGTTKESR